MKSRFTYLVGLSVILMILIAACAPATPEAQPPTEAPPPTEVPEPTEPEPTEAPMAQPGEGVTVTPLKATWDTGWFQEAIYDQLLTELGYTVEDAEAVDNPAAYLAIASGDADFWANGWFPLHDTYFDEAQVAENTTPVGFQVSNGALQGYLANSSVVEEEGFTNMGQLQDPETAALFDFDDDGKAELMGCPPGWGCELQIEEHLDEYELRDTVDHVTADYAANMADAISRYQQGENILFYTWTPNWTIGRLVPGEDVMWLDAPIATDFQTVPGVAGCVSDPCEMGWDPNDIRVVANNDFLDANPAAATLFELVEIPLSSINAQNVKMQEGEDSERDITRHAEEWVEQNRDLVDEWLAEARAAAE